MGGGKRVCGNSLYFLHNFSVTLKLLQKLKSIKNNRREIRVHSIYFSLTSTGTFYFLWVLTYYLFYSISLMWNSIFGSKALIVTDFVGGDS